MFAFDWDVLSTEDELRVTQILNDGFERLPKPDYVGRTVVSDLRFGSKPPLVQLLDLSPPDPRILKILRRRARQAQLDREWEVSTQGQSGLLSGHHMSAESSRPGDSAPVGISASSDDPDAGSVVEDDALVDDAAGAHVERHGGARHARGESPDSPETPVGGMDQSNLQIVMKLAYRGDASFKIRTELVVNYPAPGFARLPVTLWVRRLTFEGVCMLAYVDGEMHVTFENESDEVAAAAAAGEAQFDASPLKDVVVETEIGDATKPVLKNAGNLEDFIVAQLQNIIQAKLVFPNLVSVPIRKAASTAAASDPAEP